jgi:hypothetical protein
MKKGATPTNYKTVEQQRLIQDIFKTPHQQHDELSEDDLITTDKHKTFEGAENATIPLASENSPESVTTSTPVLQRFVPRPQIPQPLLRHQAEQSTSSATPGTPLRTPQSFSSRLSLGWCHHQVSYQQRRYRYQLLQELHHFHQVQVRTLIFLIRRQI